MNIEIPSLLGGLAVCRPIFHSEADFQHELAWRLKEVHPKLKVRLEYPLARPSNAAIDILIRNGNQEMALELKYLCQRIEHDIDGEPFALKPQGAQDVRRYDVLKDVARMEQFLASRPAASAAVLVLSNDPAYWSGPKHDGTSDAAFALRQGRTVTGSLDWADHTGPGTKRGREKAIDLTGTYSMNWRGYSLIDGRFGEFRYLYIPVNAK